jgi:glycosyltransferase involved in cell wall biosynthesis
VAEYLAAGLPVIATRQGDLPEIIGDAGLLVPPDDVAALAQALATLMDDTHLLGRLADAARKRSPGLDWSGVASRVEDVLTATRGSLAFRQQQVRA